MIYAHQHLFGHSPCALAARWAKSKSTSNTNPVTGGSVTSGGAQPIGNQNVVNTGTQTTVETNRTTTQNSDNTIGNNNVITYNTGIGADELQSLIGNAFSGGGGGGGGISIGTQPSNAATASNNLSTVAKWGIALVALLGLAWLWRNAKKA
jgi:hypothetical protein